MNGYIQETGDPLRMDRGYISYGGCFDCPVRRDAPQTPDTFGYQPAAAGQKREAPRMFQATCDDGDPDLAVLRGIEKYRLAGKRPCRDTGPSFRPRVLGPDCAGQNEHREEQAGRDQAHSPVIRACPGSVNDRALWSSEWQAEAEVVAGTLCIHQGERDAEAETHRSVRQQEIAYHFDAGRQKDG